MKKNIHVKKGFPSLLILGSAMATALLVSACGNGAQPAPAPVAGAVAPVAPQMGVGNITAFRYTMANNPSISWQVSSPLGQPILESYRLQLSLAQYGAGTGEVVNLIVSPNGGGFTNPTLNPVVVGPVFTPTYNTGSYRYRYRCRRGVCAIATAQMPSTPCVNQNYPLNPGPNVFPAGNNYSVTIESGHQAITSQYIVTRSFTVGSQLITQFDLNLGLVYGKTLSQAQIASAMGAVLNSGFNNGFQAGYNGVYNSGFNNGFNGAVPAAAPQVGAWITTTGCSTAVGGQCTYGTFQ